MKAVVWHGTGDVRLEEVARPVVEDETDVIVQITCSAICGADLMARQSVGTVLGGEAVGEVVDIGAQVTALAPGDRVVVPAGIETRGLWAEYARIADADTALVKIPPGVTDAQAITTARVFSQAWAGAKSAGVAYSETVAVFGAGPVGQLAILAAYCQGAGAVVAIDEDPARLALALAQQAVVIDAAQVDPASVILELTGGIGVNRVIDTGELAGRLGFKAVAASGGIAVLGEDPGYPASLTRQVKGPTSAQVGELLALIADGSIDSSLLLADRAISTDVRSAWRELESSNVDWLRVSLVTASRCRHSFVDLDTRQDATIPGHASALAVPASVMTVLGSRTRNGQRFGKVVSRNPRRR